MVKKSFFSLKFKLLLMLIGLTITVLSIYSYMALDEFKKDKMAYVFDATKSHAKNLSIQLKSNSEQVIEKIQFLMRGYNYNSSGGFHPYSKSIFKNEPNISALLVLKRDVKTDSFVVHAQLNKTNNTLNSMLENESLFIEQVTNHKISIALSKNNMTHWVLGTLFTSPNDKDTFVVIAEITQSDFRENLSGGEQQDSYILQGDQYTLFSTLDLSYHFKNQQLLYNSLFEIIKSTSLPISILEKKIDETELLISTARVGIGDIHVVSLISKDKALEAVKRLMIKSVIFLLLLISLTLFISVFASSRLTSALKKLLKATEKISSGDFDLQLNIKTNDEVEALSQGFNQMAGEIQRLLSETAEKARMEGELQTAQLVQSTLFPQSAYNNSKVNIQGYYKSASECGGDWWYYHKVGSKTLLWIGDATGHGVPAALVTSAANSAANVMIQLSELNAAQIMNNLNLAVYNTAKSKVLMTFFVAIFDENTAELSYCCASHDPPFLLPKIGDEKIKKKNILPLMENSGPRLGEGLESHYTETKIQLNPGDRIVFYTDGVTELYNGSEEQWGERRFLKSLIETFNKGLSVSSSMEQLQSDLEGFRQGSPLMDDVTYFMFEYKTNESASV